LRGRCRDAGCPWQRFVWVTSLPNLFSQPPRLSPAQPTNSTTTQKYREPHASFSPYTHNPFLRTHPDYIASCTRSSRSISTPNSTTAWVAHARIPPAMAPHPELSPEEAALSPMAIDSKNDRQACRRCLPAARLCWVTGPQRPQGPGLPSSLRPHRRWNDSHSHLVLLLG
jgi:hypothetical protein